ncbi:uncharacterized protein LOC132731518 [Ruditapes philippinarum]|uniref:uncharacterized protein LOC132731518 n=1 Tax=Ruditapes philippinarum TaxID=129788 RepID=UPI00295B954A|nr:uncharacterized protein LOC132731518 [Ruditapes philippinarum]
MNNRKKQSVQCRKPNSLNRKPITAKNIAIVQEQYERELKLREKSKIVLNGTVKIDKTSNDGFTDENDLEYEFLYSVSDEENGDHYSYEFDAYPAISKPTSTVANEFDNFDDTFCSETNVESSLINETIRSECCPRGKKVERVKSATKIIPKNKKGCLSRRPKSASLAKSTEQENAELCREKFKDEITKEVAFKDTDSVVSKSSSSRSRISAPGKTRRYERRKSVSYDPDLEKASAYIHGGGKNFSRSNTSLTPVKYGMTHLQMNYTETNLETNQCVIFLDLLKNSHQKSQIRGEQIQNIERRLEAKRNNPLHSTSFYENKNIPDPFHRNAKKTARSVAQKKLERKEKIKQMTDEIHTGYVPTQLTMKIADRSEVEDIGNKCRYLRCQTPSK